MMTDRICLTGWSDGTIESGRAGAYPRSAVTLSGGIMSSTVYTLTNPAMSGIAALGKVARDNPKVRIKWLYTTDVPLS